MFSCRLFSLYAAVFVSCVCLWEGRGSPRLGKGEGARIDNEGIIISIIV